MTENQIFYVKLFALYFGQTCHGDEIKQEATKTADAEKQTGWY